MVNGLPERSDKEHGPLPQGIDEYHQAQILKAQNPAQISVIKKVYKILDFTQFTYLNSPPELSQTSLLISQFALPLGSSNFWAMIVLLPSVRTLIIP